MTSRAATTGSRGRTPREFPRGRDGIYLYEPLNVLSRRISDVDREADTGADQTNYTTNITDLYRHCAACAPPFPANTTVSESPDGTLDVFPEGRALACRRLPRGRACHGAATCILPPKARACLSYLPLADAGRNTCRSTRALESPV